MDRARYEFLMSNPSERLTQEELLDGYFFCCTFDGLLIRKGDPEADCCGCLKDDPCHMDPS